MNELETFEEVRSKLSYDFGLIETTEQTRSPVQRQLFLETEKYIGKTDAIYFSGDIPIVYFRLLSEFDDEDVKILHRRIWNQNRIPLLYIVTPSELRIYNCFETPAEPGETDNLNTQERLIRHFNFAIDALEKLEEFSKPQLDSGMFWKSTIGRHFRNDHRVDQRLLEELQKTREQLHNSGLSYPLIHNLLGRSIFILYLEDRGAIKPDYYKRFAGEATSYVDILADKNAAYELFTFMEEKFNGDLFPVQTERYLVEVYHLELVRKLFSGTDMSTGQQMLWRPYDFGIIPIEFISAIYEQFLHKEEGKDYTSDLGVYYTPHPLVEFILNEVLPWPSEKDSRFNLRILDPSCGSGIFLVDAFRRLVARWMYSQDTDEIPHGKLREILSNSIYGIDINADAIKVAAFSLYLALLDYLEPKAIWEEFRFPHLVYDSQSTTDAQRNLFPMDAFPYDESEKLPFESLEYDLVVGNPPWKRNRLPAHIARYCAKHNFAKELAQAFLWRVRDFVSDKGKIALVGTSKILFNIEGPDKNFRHAFFSDNYVESVINFSALRKTKGSTGKQLFASAVGPAAVFIYQTTPPTDSRPTIIYCTPKPTRLDNALSGIVIDASEIKFLPRNQVVSIDKIWKIAMWGTHRDFDIINNLSDNETIGVCIDSLRGDGWNLGRGYNKPGTEEKHDEEISNLLFMPTQSIRRYWLDADGLDKVGEKWFWRLGAKKAYFAPHILIKEGQLNKRFCAAFADFDCAFKYAVFGITGPDTELLKALTAFLNSSLASYFLFLTASTWGIERERVLPTEMLSLPGIPFNMHSDTIENLAQKVDELGRLIWGGGSVNETSMSNIESEIDQLIFDELDLSQTERNLIKDVLEYSLDFFQEGEKSAACDSTDTLDVETYATVFCDTINQMLQFGEFQAWATIYDSDTTLNLVSIHFNNTQKAGSVKIQKSTAKFSETLAKLEKRLQTKYSESIYVRRNVRFYDDDTLHIAKPDEKRFWSRSMALRDADETIAEGIHGAQ